MLLFIVLECNTMELDCFPTLILILSLCFVIVAISVAESLSFYQSFMNWS